MDAYVYTLHSEDCKFRANKFYRKCRCRKWIYEFGRRKRYSAKTRSWERAEQLIKKDGPKQEGMTVGKAVEQFLRDKRNQNVSQSWLRKFELLLDGWVPDRTLESIALCDLEAFRNSWTGAPVTKRKKQERLRSFLHYCVRHKWITYNPAIDLSKIKVADKPTMPLDKDQYKALLDSAEGPFRALVLLMRYSGLRIRDAVRLSPDCMIGNKVFLYTQKTGVPVCVPIPPSVADEIRPYIPLHKPGMSLKRRLNVFQEKFQTRGAHSHQLRDTFSVELLLAGVSIEDVSQLLGHSDIKITIRHYAPWVKARQEQLEASVQKAWS